MEHMGRHLQQAAEFEHVVVALAPWDPRQALDQVAHAAPDATQSALEACMGRVPRGVSHLLGGMASQIPSALRPAINSCFACSSLAASRSATVVPSSALGDSFPKSEAPRDAHELLPIVVASCEHQTQPASA